MSNRRRVTYAKLHQTAFLPAPLSELGSTLPSRSKSFHSFEMFHTTEGIEIEAKLNARTPVVYGLIPWGNVAAAGLGAPVEASVAFNGGTQITYASADSEDKSA